MIFFSKTFSNKMANKLPNFPKRDLKQHDRIRLSNIRPNIRNVFGGTVVFPTWKGGCFTHFEASKRGQQGTGSGMSEKGIHYTRCWGYWGYHMNQHLVLGRPSKTFMDQQDFWDTNDMISHKCFLSLTFWDTKVYMSAIFSPHLLVFLHQASGDTVHRIDELRVQVWWSNDVAL